jgi:hypothetical protein
VSAAEKSGWDVCQEHRGHEVVLGVDHDEAQLRALPLGLAAQQVKLRLVRVVEQALRLLDESVHLVKLSRLGILERQEQLGPCIT